MYKNKFLAFLSLTGALFFLFLFPCHAAPSPSSESSFVKTGLLTHSDESAEEILLRAHNLDSRAMLLAIAGYLDGIGGFPKASELAFSWVQQMTVLGNIDNLCLAALMFSRKSEGNKEALPIPVAQAYCRFARQSEYADSFTRAGIFDLKAACDQADSRKDQAEEGEKRYKSLLEREQGITAYVTAMRILRELNQRPANDDDLKKITVVESFSLGAFYAATTGDSLKETPKWDGANLVAFIDVQSKQTEYSSTLSDATGLRGLRHEAAFAFQQRLLEPPEQALGTIRRAHQGEPEAIQDMILWYMGGRFGFLQSPPHSQGWMAFGGLKGDTRCQLQTAVYSLIRHRPDAALVWARIAQADAQGPLKPLAAKITRLLEKSLTEQRLVQVESSISEIRLLMQKRGEQDKAQ